MKLVGFSAITGDGMEQLFEAVAEARVEYDQWVISWTVLGILFILKGWNVMLFLQRIQTWIWKTEKKKSRGKKE